MKKTFKYKSCIACIIVFTLLTVACGNNTQNDTSSENISTSGSSVIYLEGEEKVISDRKVPKKIIKDAKKDFKEVVYSYESDNIGDMPNDFTKNKFSIDDFSLEKPFRIKCDGYYDYVFPVRWKGTIVDFETIHEEGNSYWHQYGPYFDIGLFRKVDELGLTDKIVIVSKDKINYAKTKDGRYFKISVDIGEDHSL